MKVLLQKILGLSDGWSQAQREAMIDLCLLGMYSDNLISIAEQDFIEGKSTELKWESRISFDSYLQSTIPQIRSFKDDPQKVEDLLKSINRRLGGDEFKRKAIDELKSLIASDGVVPVEEEFLSKVQKVMGL